MADFKDITSYVPLKRLVGAAAMDTHADLGLVERDYYHWAARGLKKLTRETLKSGKRYLLLTVNKNFNTVILPCDFEEELFVGYIDSKNQKVAIPANNNLVNSRFIETIPCDEECEAKCKCCYPKQACTDMQTTQTINKIDIFGTEYDETVMSTLTPSGEYFTITTTPVYNTITSQVEYIERKEYVTSFETELCGCIKETEENKTKLQTYCNDVYCCYCCDYSDACCDVKGSYRIFEENGILQLSNSFKLDKVYIEYRGSLPKKNGVYVVPEVAFETLVEWIKVKEIRNKKGVPKWQRDDQLDDYKRERANMEKVMGRTSLEAVMRILMTTPKFDFYT